MQSSVIATAWVGPSTQSMPASLSFCMVLGLEPHRLVGRDQGHVGGVAADEQGLGDAVAVAADHADLLVGDLIAVADRAIADEAAGQRVVVKLLVHRRAAVGDAGREQDGARRRAARAPGRGEQAAFLVALELGHELGLDLRAIFARLVAHPLEQLLARDPVGKAGDGCGCTGSTRRGSCRRRRPGCRGGSGRDRWPRSGPRARRRRSGSRELARPCAAQWIVIAAVPR